MGPRCIRWLGLESPARTALPGSAELPTDLHRPRIEGTPGGAWLKQHTPMARFGDDDEIAGAAIYLISDAASYVTGETIVIDGGFLARGV